MNILLLTLILAQPPVGQNQPLMPPDSLKCPTYADTIWPIDLLVTSFEQRNSIAYQIDWGDDTVLVWSSFFPPGYETEHSHHYERQGNFQVRVRIKDKNENISDWSKPLPLTVGKDIIKWAFEATYGIYSTPALDNDDNIYFGTEEGFFYCLNPNGSLRWVFQTRGPIYSSAAIGKNGIYFGCSDSSLYCLDFKGQKIWEFKANEEIFSTPAIDQRGMIYFGCEDSILYAINDKGKLVWTYKTADEIPSSPAIGPDGTIYVTAESLYAITPAGKRRYTFQPSEDGYYASSPIVDLESNVYFGGTDGFLYALNPNGRMKWRAGVMDEDQIRSELSIGLGDTILLGCEDGFVYKKGKFGPLIPIFESEDEILAAPVMDEEGHIYFLSDDGYFYCLERDGRLRWKLEIGMGGKSVFMTSTATIGKDGTVYVGTQDNVLFAFNGTSGIAPTVWPTFHQNVKHTGRTEKFKRSK